MGDNVNLTKRVRRRRQKDGRVIPQLRYVVNYQEPKTGKRRQQFFKKQKEAQARQAELQSQLHSGSYFDARRAPTVTAAVDHYLAERSGKVKASTLAGYRVVV